MTGPARYVYGIVPADPGQAPDFACVGLDGSRVYIVAQDRIGALVHDCPAEPYRSDDADIAAGWVLAHHRVAQLALVSWGSILPMTFNTIVAPSEYRTSDENLVAWLEAEHDRLQDRLDLLRGRAEFSLQVSFAPAVVFRKIAEEVPEIRQLEERTRARSGGLAYLYAQELERLLRREAERRTGQFFTMLYERVRSCAERVQIEKGRKDDSGLSMAANLSCLVALERYPGFKALADEIALLDGYTVRLVGPLPAYSFC